MYIIIIIILIIIKHHAYSRKTDKPVAHTQTVSVPCSAALAGEASLSDWFSAELLPVPVYVCEHCSTCSIGP